MSTSTKLSSAPSACSAWTWNKELYSISLCSCNAFEKSIYDGCCNVRGNILLSSFRVSLRTANDPPYVDVIAIFGYPVYTASPNVALIIPFRRQPVYKFCETPLLTPQNASSFSLATIFHHIPYFDIAPFLTHILPLSELINVSWVVQYLLETAIVHKLSVRIDTAWKQRCLFLYIIALREAPFIGNTLSCNCCSMNNILCRGLRPMDRPTETMLCTKILNIFERHDMSTCRWCALLRILFHQPEHFRLTRHYSEHYGCFLVRSISTDDEKQLENFRLARYCSATALRSFTPRMQSLGLMSLVLA